jgi:hypothetical protein
VASAAPPSASTELSAAPRAIRAAARAALIEKGYVKPVIYRVEPTVVTEPVPWYWIVATVGTGENRRPVTVVYRGQPPKWELVRVTGGWDL